MAAVNIQVLARTGAEVRLAQIRAEIASLHAAFPGISSSGVGEISKRRRRRRRGKLSPAQRKAIGERTRAYWAARRAGKSAKGAAKKAAAKSGGYKRSAASRRKMAAAQKKRWAAIKAKKAAE